MAETMTIALLRNVRLGQGGSPPHLSGCVSLLYHTLPCPRSCSKPGFYSAITPGDQHRYLRQAQQNSIFPCFAQTQARCPVLRYVQSTFISTFVCYPFVRYTYAIGLLLDT